MKQLIPLHKSTDIFQELRQEMNRMLENTFGEFEISENEGILQKSWRPAIEMCEKDNNYILKAQLPGLDKNDIDIEVLDNSIKIKGEREYKQESTEENVYRSEFRYGKFLRHINFPSEVKPDEAEAHYENGVLNITVPKVEEETHKTKKLEID